MLSSAYPYYSEFTRFMYTHTYYALLILCVSVWLCGSHWCMCMWGGTGSLSRSTAGEHSPHDSSMTSRPSGKDKKPIKAHTQHKAQEEGGNKGVDRAYCAMCAYVMLNVLIVLCMLCGCKLYVVLLMLIVLV